MKRLNRTQFFVLTVAASLVFWRLGGEDPAPLAEANAIVEVAPPAFIKEANGNYSMTGVASWYSRRSPGINKRTANNEVFEDTSMTCAMWGPAFNSKVRVTNLRNGRSVVLRVNDRGPHGRYFRKGRIIDLTKSAFKKLSNSKNGLIDVKVEFL